MNLSILEPSTPPLPPTAVADSEPGARAFVWVVWGLMMVAAAGYVVAFGPEFPLWDDYGMAPVLAGRQAMDLEWLWAWSNEFRYPLTKFLMVSSIKATGNDFRAGMFLSVATLGALAIGLAWAARQIRGGSRYTDAFFPIVCLNWGHYAAFSWCSVFGLVGPSTLGGGVAVLTLGRGRPTWRRAVAASVLMALLPLCGASGIALVPGLSFWFWGLAVSHWRSRELKGSRRALGVLALLLPTLVLCLLYFRGFERPPNHSPSGGVEASIRTTLQFLSFGFGPAAQDFWPIGGWVAPLLVGFAAMALVGAWTRRPEDRLRTLALLGFLAASTSLALGIGGARSGMGVLAGFQDRYTSMPILGLCAVYLVSEVAGGAIARRLIPMALLLSVTALLGGNTRLGLEHGREVAAKSAAFRSDLKAWVPVSELVRRHTPFLHPSQDELRKSMLMLHESKIRPYRDLRMDPTFREVEVPLTPSKVTLLRWSDGVARAFGVDPWLTFQLPQPQYVAGLRIRYSHSNPTRTSSHFKAAWGRVDQPEFPKEQTYANWSLPTGPDRETTVWIGDTIGAFRIQPDNQPCEFRISGLTLLVP